MTTEATAFPGTGRLGWVRRCGGSPADFADFASLWHRGHGSQSSGQSATRCECPQQRHTHLGELWLPSPGLLPVTGALGCLGASSPSCKEPVVVGVGSDPKPCNVIALEEAKRTVSEGDAN